MIVRGFLILSLVFVATHGQAQAQGVTYYADPPYALYSDEESHPLAEMIRLGKEGDVRAQFILGDLYAKGKGGLKKDPKQAQKWFDQAARQDYAPAFVRLAALAKHDEDVIQAYAWYRLGAQRTGQGAWRRYINDAMRDLNLDRAQKRQANDLAQAWRRGDQEQANVLDKD